QTYVPKDALEKIEPPPPPPQPKKKKWYQKVWSVVSGVVSTVVRGLPGIGQIYSFATAIAGRDFITGQKLSGADRWLSLLGPLARGASMFKQTANLANTINKTKDAISKVNTYAGYLKNPEQAFLAGLNLGKKYDLGHLSSLTNKAGSLYNSLIENKYYKFGTALTGKDVWGNKLTWEERVAGLKSYQRNSDWNNKFGDVIEGIIWKKNINLPKIDLPKINLPGLDLEGIKMPQLALSKLADFIIEQRGNGGTQTNMDNIWNTTKDGLEKLGLTKKDLENAVRDKYKEIDLTHNRIQQLEKELKILFAQQYASTTPPDPNQFKRYNELTDQEKIRFAEISIELNSLAWTPGRSTATFVRSATKEAYIDWWKDLSQGVEIGIGFVPVVETVYDVFCAVSGYSITGKLTPLERAIAIGCVLAPVAGASVGPMRATFKTAKNLFHNHHLLPKQFEKRFLEIGFNTKELNKLLTIELPINLHNVKPKGIHTKAFNWNKQWKEFLNKKPIEQFSRGEILDQLENMLKAHPEHYTKQQVDDIMKIIDELRQK
ncbi:MAG: pre-toxin TG domain-containing protein, partial [bacterium]